MAGTRAEIIVFFIVGLVFFGLSVYSTSYIVKAHRTKVRIDRTQEISLGNFSVSNLNIIDDRISGDWTIGLNLINPTRKPAVYTDIKYTVALSAAPDEPIAGFHQGYPTVQRPNKRTAVYLHSSAERLPVNHTAVAGIGAGAVEFDLTAVVKRKSVNLLDSGRLELTCKGVRVLFSPTSSSSKTGLLYATGSATEIPACNLVKSRAFEF